MGDNSLTVRGKKWERKNSMWILWSIFLLAGVGFIKIGRKAKEKKWIGIGIFYFIFLWGGMYIAGILDEKTMETYSIIYFVVYIGSIVHSFISKKSYLIKYDKVLHKHEIELEEEKIKRNIQEQELIQKQNNIELEKIDKIENDTSQTTKVDVVDEQIEQNANIEDKVETSKSKKKKWLTIYGIAVVLIIAIICMFEDGSDTYYDSIEIDNNSSTGAVFNYSFSDVKSIVGSNLSIGDLNSSSGGWNQISSTSSYTEYNIVSTAGVWAVNVGVDSNDNVFSIVCKTVGLDNGSPNDSEIESFASVFAEIIGTTPDSTYSVLKELCASSNQTRTYNQGVQITYQKTSGGSCSFGITAMSEEYWNSIQ